MGITSISKEILIKTVIIFLFFISLISCKEIVQGPEGTEAPLSTVWSLTPPPAVYPYNASGLNITVTNNAVFSTIKYTTDGSDPISFGAVYSGSITITGPCTVKFISVLNNVPSAVYSAYYTFKLPPPTFTPPGGLYNETKYVVLTDPTGAVIRYTTNGSTPNSGSSIYAAAIEVNSNFPIKAYSSNTGLGYVDSDVATHNYVIMPGLFVKTTGNNANLGTPDAPFATITHALSVAAAGTKIYVAAGTYNESITIDNNKTVLGGYNNANWLDVNLQYLENPTYRTEIVGTTTTAVTVNNCNNLTRLQGFIIRPGGAGSDSRGVFITGGNPVIRFNIINSGNGSSSSKGIYVDGGSEPSITQNIINGTNSANTESYGIHAIGAGVNTKIFNNLIFGGAGMTSYSIRLTNSGAKIFNNTISAGSRIGATAAYGFYADPCNGTELKNNVIFTDGTAATFFPVYVNVAPGPMSSYNTFTALYGGAFATTGIGDILAPVVLDVFKRPTAASHPSIQTGGTDLSIDFNVDIQGNLRTVPWSRGCYKY